MSGREGKPRVLVVDDDVDHAMMLELLFDAAGYEATSATSLATALTAMTALGDGVDVLVSDFSLGDGTAIDLLHRAPKRPRLAIVLTGFDSDEDVKKTRAAGFDAHFVKPASIEALCQTIDAALASRS